MSIRKKISWLFIGIVTFIWICNNTVQLYWTKNIILEKLSDSKCDEMKGYLFSKPLPAQEFEEKFLTK
ncbi:hypothetical protein [Ectobacillus antri]|jgi:hypothetical protein|uniref:hypothetical protein n=1 Tax=Ectobacillus antri TaxID=2486280 RepID=UPI000F59E428|nr:hypothetical protein [Ectobacillus antri]